ncbi:MAG: hypothetical protein ACPH9N_00315 [Alteromonas sp.]
MSRTTKTQTTMGMYFIIHDLTADEELFEESASFLRNTQAFCEQHNIDATFLNSHDFTPMATIAKKSPQQQLLINSSRLLRYSKHHWSWD